MNRLWDIILETDKLKSTVVHLMRAMKKEPCWLGLRLRQRSLWEEKAKEKDL